MGASTCTCMAMPFSWTDDLRSKVPLPTIWFWVIKVLATTVGESLADYINENLGLGLAKTTYIMIAVFVPIIVAQLWALEYIPAIYWLVIVSISVVGTLITDNLTDNVGVELWKTIIIFGILLTATFIAWYSVEKSLSIHSITTRRRERFYWFTILFTFALGTAVGDQFSEGLGIGYWQTALIFGAIIAADFLAYLFLHLNSIFAFWFAYVLTRPLGASIGDYLSQDTVDGGLGLGAGVTSAIFIAIIIAAVGYLTVTKKDVISVKETDKVYDQPV